jgi:pyruvate dehydrogenase E1 component beta subunit
VLWLFKGLLAEFGEERIRDTPLAEAGFTGAGIGAALGGMRPIVEIMTVNFSLLALDQIVNTAAAIRHMSGGQFSVPLVIRMATGAGRQLAAQHSHSLENWFAHVPGIKVVAPATVADARGMLWTALQDPDPVVMFEHAMLYNDEGEIATEGDLSMPIEGVAIRRPGTDCSIITYGGSLKKALAAATDLVRENINCEVIDLRALRPLDDKTILASVEKTHRAVIVDEGWRTGSLAAEISALIMEGAFFALDAPVARVCSASPSLHVIWKFCHAAVAGIVGGARVLAMTATAPSLGPTWTGTLVEWLKKPGDQLKRGDTIAVVETQKGAIEIEVFHDGVLEATHVKTGTRVPVGEVLATIRTAEEPESAQPVPPEVVTQKPVYAPPAQVVAPLKPGLKITPAASSRAKELGIDVQSLLRAGWYHWIEG